MIGQKHIQDIVKRYIESDTLPRTLLLEGEYGCGKHTLCRTIAEWLSMPLEDITSILTLETIERITLSATPKVYLIDSSKISIKEQNIILKFLEEPLKNSYIIVICESKAMLLNTVVNRCLHLSFEQYSDEEKASFVKDGSKWTTEMFCYANTPGRIIEFENKPVSEMIEFAKKVLIQVRVANYSNILTIPNKISFKEDSELFDFSVFSYLLVECANTLYNTEVISYLIYELTNEFYNNTKIPHINKQHLFEHFLIELKETYDRSK